MVVGVNRFAVEEEKPIPIQRIDEAQERKQVERLRALRARRDPGAWQASFSKSKTPPAPGKISCRESWPRSNPTPRSAKSRTRCAPHSRRVSGSVDHDERSECKPGRAQPSRFDGRSRSQESQDILKLH